MSDFKIKVGAELDSSAISGLKEQLKQQDVKIDIDIDTKKVLQQIKEVQKALKEINNGGTKGGGSSTSNSLSGYDTVLNKLNAGIRNTSTGFKAFNSDLVEMKANLLANKNSAEALSTVKTKLNEITNSAKDMNAQQKQATTWAKNYINATNKLSQVDKYWKENSKAAKQYGEEHQKVVRGYQENIASNGKTDLTPVNSQWAELQAKIRAAGLEGKTFGDQMRAAASSFSTWIGVSTIVMSTIHVLKDGVRSIIELDTAMVELRKVTEATESQFQSFYYSANETAKSLGATTAEVIQATASFAQLGYSLTEAQTLAQTAIKFSTISPEMNIEQSTDGLISTIKAYKIDAADALDGVASKVNIVGNNFAVTNEDVINGLENSSAALSNANNTLDQNIALITAG